MLLFMTRTAMKDSVSKSATAIRFPEELHGRLREAAEERHYSINFMVVMAVEEFLDRLIPVDQLKLTRD
jgi:predicted transcriptional regulator